MVSTLFYNYTLKLKNKQLQILLFIGFKKIIRKKYLLTVLPLVNKRKLQLH